MADKEQVDLLKRGAEAWNAWRNVRPGDQIDLFGADLNGANLIEADLSNADLIGANLSNADLYGTNLRRACLRSASLIGANLRRADLNGTHLRRANLSNANLSNANLVEANLSGANLSGANLSNARLGGAHLFGAKLDKADLCNADLVEANLSNAKLGGAHLRSANLNNANLAEATLKGTGLGSASLAKTNGLEYCIHTGPSSIDAKTLELSKGKIPDVFLKGCGFSDWEILNAKLHDPNLRPDQVTDICYEVINLRTKAPIQVNSVFISYSSEDKGFAEAIEKRLDADGIRSWRDVHDMIAGPMEEQIEKAIQLQGTVLLVLSKNSLGSDWVEWEVRRAREIQKDLQKDENDPVHVLCPVALDDTWAKAKWPKRLMAQLKEYLVLDFSDWDDDDSFEREYLRLRKGIAKYYGK